MTKLKSGFNFSYALRLTIRADAVVVLLTTGILKNPFLTQIIQQALEKKLKIVLVYDVESSFPQPNEISKLPVDVQGVFNSIAVPLIHSYSSFCWKKISAKVFEEVTVKLFLTLKLINSHSQKSIIF